MNSEQTPLICLAGPTASGKSAVCQMLAEHLPIEIINVDSATIYRGMDIGTAKPSANERARVKHHLLDILDPSQSYSAAQFRDDALAVSTTYASVAAYRCLPVAPCCTSKSCATAWTIYPAPTPHIANPLRRRPVNRAGRRYTRLYRLLTRHGRQTGTQ